MEINSRYLLLQHVNESTLNENQREELVSLLKRYQKEKNIYIFCNGLKNIFDGKFVQNKQLLHHIQKSLNETHKNEFRKLIKRIGGSRRSSRHRSEPSASPRVDEQSNGHIRSQTEPIILNASLTSQQDNLSLSKTKKRQSKYLRDQKNILPSRNDLFTSKLKYKCVTLSQLDVQSNNDLGFIICGGIEKKSMIYISHVSSNSVAEKHGLQKGDCIIEINGTTLETFRLLEVAKIINNSKILKLILHSNNHLPEDVLFHAVNPWSLESPYAKNSVPYQFHNGDSPSMGTLRTVVISLGEDVSKKVIGFNIRGGIQHGIGLYVTNILSGSPAEKSGLRVGDQILEVNGESFELMSNTEAVRFMKKQKRFAMKVVARGKIPEGKHYVEEYTWLTLDGERISSRPGTPTTPSERFDTSDTFYDFPELPLDSQDRSYSPHHTVKRPESPQVRFSDSDDSVITNNRPATPTKRKSMKKLRKSLRKEHKRKFSDASSTENYPIQDSVNLSRRQIGRQNDENNNLHNKEGLKKSSSLNDLRDFDHLTEMTMSRYGSMGNLPKKKTFGEKVRNALSWNKKRIHERENKRNLFDSALFTGGNHSNNEKSIEQLDSQLRSTLTVQEYKSVNDAMKECLETGDINRFTEQLLNSINTPGKHTLIAEIRNVVFPYALGRNCTKQIEDSLNKQNENFIHYEVSVPITNTENSRLPITNTENSRLANTNTENSRLANTNTENSRLPITNTENSRLPVEQDRLKKSRSGMHLKKNIFGFAKVQKKQVYEINKNNEQRTLNGIREDGRRYPANTLNEFVFPSDDSNNHDPLKPSSLISVNQIQNAEQETSDNFHEFLKPETAHGTKMSDLKHKRHAVKRRSRSAHEIEGGVRNGASSQPRNNNNPSSNTRLEAANITRIRKSQSVGSFSFETPPPRRVSLKLEQPGAYSSVMMEDKDFENPYTSVRRKTFAGDGGDDDTDGYPYSSVSRDKSPNDDFNPYTSVRRNTNQFPQESLGDPYNPYASIGTIKREQLALKKINSNNDIFFDGENEISPRGVRSQTFSEVAMVHTYKRTHSLSNGYTDAISIPDASFVSTPARTSNSVQDDSYSTPVHIPTSKSNLQREPTYAQVNKNRKKSNNTNASNELTAYDVSLEKSLDTTNKHVPLSKIKINQAKRKEKKNAETQVDFDMEEKIEDPYSTVIDHQAIPLRSYDDVRSNDDVFIRKTSLDNILTIGEEKQRKASNRFRTIRFSKGFESLGLTISGGTKMKPDIKVAQVHQGTAASHTQIQVGHILVSLDGESLVDVTHSEAVQMFRHSYKDKSRLFMEVVVIEEVK